LALKAPTNIKFVKKVPGKADALFKDTESQGRYALVLSGGGIRAIVFHLGLLLRLAAEERLEQVSLLSTVSGGSLAAGLVFSRADLIWPSSRSFIETILPQIRLLLTARSLQAATAVRTMLRPWKLFSSRGDLFAKAIESKWGIRGTLKQISEMPRWYINATCYETGRNWRFSQRHIGDWKFGHNFQQAVPVSVAIAASSAIPYMAGFVKLKIEPEGWFSIDPATDEPLHPVKPARKDVRLWDGGVYENLGVEPVYKPQRGMVANDHGLMIVSDASAYLDEDLRPATGVFTNASPFLRPPRLFDIATEQTRALRSRMIMEAIVNRKLAATIVRLGRSVAYIDDQAKRTRDAVGSDVFLHADAVKKAATYPTNASKMLPHDFLNVLRHGFETADATLTGHRPAEFPTTILWHDVAGHLHF
jgi:NTE family protein